MTEKGRKVAAALVLGGLVIAAGWGLWIVRPVLAPFLMAVIIAYLTAPLIHALGNLGLTRGWAIGLVFAGLTGLVALAVAKVLPGLIGETRGLTEAIPDYSQRAQSLVDGLQQRVREMGMPPNLRDTVHRSIAEMEIRSVQALERLLSAETITRAAGFFLSLLLAPFLAIYLLRDLERFKERFVASLPGRYRMEILALLRGLDGVLAGFVRGQVVLAVAVGVMAGFATWLLGLRYAILLGLWAGLTEFVPYVGPVLGAIPAVLAGLSVSPLLGFQVALAFAIIQQLENAVLSPKILGESLGLHPLVVMMSVMAGGYLWGAWGLIFALPLVGVIRVFWCFLIARLTERPRVDA